VLLRTSPADRRVLGAALVGAILPYTGLAPLLGFTPLPTAFFLLLFGMVVVYLLLVELAKTRFYRLPHARSSPPVSTHAERMERRIRAPGISLHTPPDERRRQRIQRRLVLGGLISEYERAA
jgi:P-type Mg2+ transporter